MANYRDLTDHRAVLKAIEEFDKLGQTEFLNKYGYGKALRFMLIHNGKQYDSKAIVGAAYQHQYGRPLRNTDFSGGQSQVVPKLESLGFKVVALKLTDETAALPEEVPDSMWEGGKRVISVNQYERSANARVACIEANGSRCVICEFDFGETYGEQFQGFIHVHHKIPVSQIGARYEVDPVNDLVPLCPNCHAVVHYNNENRSLDEVKQLLRTAKKRGV